MAAASLFVLDLDREVYAAETLPMVSHINVGWGADISIRELAERVGCAESMISTFGSAGIGSLPVTENLYSIKSVFTPDETMRVPFTFESDG